MFSESMLTHLSAQADGDAGFRNSLRGAADHEPIRLLTDGTFAPGIGFLNPSASGRIDPPDLEFGVSRTSRVSPATGFRTMADLICIV
jgi:hypothetical protein